MAADQRRKRLSGASIVGFGSREQDRHKRRNFGPVQNDLNMKSHISVEWDANQRRVVAKREQIGISWKQMKPLVNFVPSGHNILADVFPVPEEIFDLDNLSKVLSYEVWMTHLSDDERNLLMNFLPRGLEPHQVVQELLSGDNFHFGNPFLKWGTSFCSGDLHPDMIVDREKHLKSDKKLYYAELHNYHHDMIGYLKKLKEKWEHGQDPEKEIMPKTWRSNNVEKRMPLNLYESRVYNHDENVTASSESGSWAAEEKAFSSDNQISLVRKGDKLQKRAPDKGSVKGKPRNLIVSSDDMLNERARPMKGDKLLKRITYSSESNKYMSCIKISKKQHELVKSMKQTGKSIESRSLNRVLGNLDNIHVQSYEVFIKEEQKKLHEHWLQLVNKDLPVAYTNWTQRHKQRNAVIISLVVEIKDKPKKLLLEDEDGESSGSKLQDQEEDGGHDDQSISKDTEDSISRSPENQSLTHNSYRGSDNEVNSTLSDSEKTLVLSKSGDDLQKETEYSRNMNTQDVPVGEGTPFSSRGGDVWQAPEMPHSYYDSGGTHEYTASGMSLANPQVNEEQQTHLIDLESDLHQEETSKKLQRQSGDGSFSYPNQDRSDLLQSLFKGEGVLSYHQEQKGAGLDFLSSNNAMIGDGQFSGHFKEPLPTSFTLDQVHRRPSEVYMPENISDNIYSDGGSRYMIPRQDPLSAVNMSDWAGNASRMSAPPQSHLNTGEFIGQHWFPADHQVRGAWSGSDGGSLSSQSLSTGGNSDQSLFSVLSQCNQLRAANPYDPVRHTDQFVTTRSYGAVDASIPRLNAAVPQTSHPLDYLSGREAHSSLLPDDSAWMNLPHQNPALLDQMGKPYLRSWNR
ncbi:uncharacterized protein LOC129315501 [Prosopis cineraria]|uniref:uncharacterized protein LOC129315501 n=1 Tax=Prosopis cineraria TaxID=364024 RepID=UPI00240ECA11|nr:uncharacterized protein LOC129315501 [Prosopis cineraria]